MLLITAFSVSRIYAADICAPEKSPEIVAQVIKHELGVASYQGRWMYTATYVRDGVRYVARTIETDEGFLTWVLSHDGIPLSGAENASQRNSIRELISNPGLLDRNKRAAQEDATRINTFLRDLPDSAKFECLTRSKGVARVKFGPKAGYSPRNVEGRIIAGMSGTLELDLNDMRLISANAAMENDLLCSLALAVFTREVR